eukprot:Tbor_TRINITY_DN2185_c0_g1::TRINITY_DN2185_c0_g1_i1::g.5436::m.5436
MSSSGIKVEEDGTTVITEDLLKIAGGTFDVSTLSVLCLSFLNVRVFQCFDNCNALTVLNMSHNSLSSIDTRAIAPLAETLQELDLSFNCLVSPAPLICLTKLHTLKLQENCIDSFENVTILSNLPLLRSISLQSPDFVSHRNPICVTNSREEYVNVMTNAFKNLRCLDGHYFGIDEIDPNMTVKIDDGFRFELPPTKPWITPEQLTPSCFNYFKFGQITEKAFYSAVSDAKKTARIAKEEIA